MKLNGHPTQRLPNTLNVRVSRRTGSTLFWRQRRVWRHRPGLLVTKGARVPSPVLAAMGLSDDDALGSVRLSLGRLTTEVDITTAAAGLVAAWRVLRGT